MLLGPVVVRQVLEQQVPGDGIAYYVRNGSVDRHALGRSDIGRFSRPGRFLGTVIRLRNGPGPRRGLDHHPAITHRDLQSLLSSQPAGAGFSYSRDASAFTTVYDPTSPDADGKGLVALPNVDIAGEAVNLITARFQFAASAKVAQIAMDTQKTLLDTLA